jgi:hypothetical protein
MLRPHDDVGRKHVIEPIGVARLDQPSDWPDCVVHVEQGTIAFGVAKLAVGERFRVRTADAEVEARGTRFVIAVEREHLMKVDVSEGVVEVRQSGRKPVLVEAGGTWAPSVQTAAPAIERRDIVPSAPPEPVEPSSGSAAGGSAEAGSADVAAEVVVAPRPSKRDPARPSSKSRATVRTPDTHAAGPRGGRTASRDSAGTRDVKSAHDAAAGSAADAALPRAADAPVAPKPGEREFRDGTDKRRSGDLAGATAAFTTACRLAGGDSLAEDACFEMGATAKLAGRTAAARQALTSFLDRFPGSARVGEASALLGWLLFDAGELDAAERRFQRATHDPVPRVRASAAQGLEAIAQRR